MRQREMRQSIPMKPLQRPFLAPLLTFLARLRYRSLFLIAVALLGLNLIIPDAIPFIDEILLGIATIVLARLRKPEEAPPPGTEPQRRG